MSQFSATGPALGWLHQIRSALVLLLDHEDAELRLEGLDDIDLVGAGSSENLFQVKHRAPDYMLSDSSADLWKTLRVWSSHVADGSVNLDKALFTLVTTASAPVDSAAADLRAGTGRNVESACNKLLWVALESKSSTLKASFDVFLSLDAIVRERLLSNIHVMDDSPDIHNARKLLEGKLALSVAREYREALADRVEGWWFGRCVKHLRGELPHLSGLELFDMVTELSQQFQLGALPIDFYNLKPSDAEVKSLEARVFVHQLTCLEISSQRIQYAISDYYRAYAQRSRWARDKLLIGDELTEYEEKLRSEWDRIRLALEDELPKPVAEDQLQQVGIKLLRWMETTADLRIREKVAEPYVMRGSYHMLADASPPKVWWHPEFVSRISKVLAGVVK